MKTKLHFIINGRGFTLLEIIVTLIVASILGTTLFQLTNVYLGRSVKPITFVQKFYSLNHIIEHMTSEYKKLIESDANPDPLETFKTSVGGEGPQNNNYGNYTVVKNDYIKFDGNNEISDAVDKRILKVSITRDDQSLTVLFTK